VREILDGFFYSNQLNVSNWNEFIKRLRPDDSRIDYLFTLGDILFPNNIEFLKAKQTYFKRTKQIDDLLTNTHKLLEASHWSDREYLIDLATIYHKQDDHVASAECLQKILLQNPSDCGALGLWHAAIEFIKLTDLAYDVSIYNMAVDKSGCPDLKRF
jgi:tetratricopeptide (TPR) repeat protein